jgi:hypothetical protein
LIPEEEVILKEVRDHAKYWHSDKAKRITVEKHLEKKGLKDVHVKVDELIRWGKLILIPQPRGDYLRILDDELLPLLMQPIPQGE